ncbi:hypothetical protein [Sphingomonas sp.]|jgi:ElaB/YqjD/DUF883 family membrane-anchored ribosome-binding protein|uniref:hypothetical protein n=1 Tax=Sphingomonas sp. TaxID=28214 RepID=UPI002DF2F193|nr:hypothetical protein [Sphingomonas sp.]
MASTAQNQSSTTNSSNSTMGSLKNAIGNNQMASKATEFAKQRPWATAALAGVVGMALLNTLRGRGMARAR